MKVLLGEVGTATPEKMALGCIAFAIFWVLAVFPSVPFLPVGRTAGSLVGAMLMVIFQVISPEEAYAAIDLPILGLLFGTMVVSIFLERADMFKHLSKLLLWKSKGPKDLLVRTCLVSAISSALFTNDTSCVVLTEFILKIAAQNNLQPQPIILALASSANIGSAVTPIGNPQNLVIAVQSGIPFWKFMIGVFPAMAVGVFANAVILLCYFGAYLSVERGEEVESVAGEVVIDDDATMSQSDPLMQRLTNSEDDIETAITSVQISSSLKEVANGEVSTTINEQDADTRRLKAVLWKASVYVVTVGMLISLVLGLNMSWTAITAALILLALDFKDARPCLQKVSYSLLVFFCGMFITVYGFNKTGIPSDLWELVEPYARIDSARGIALLALVIIVLSNVASNLPTVLMLGARVAASAALISPKEETRAWLILAWVSTVGGNLSLLGSAANLIVCEQASHAPFFSYNLSFFSHLRFGIPSTIVVTTVGLLLVTVVEPL